MQAIIIAKDTKKVPHYTAASGVFVFHLFVSSTLQNGTDWPKVFFVVAKIKLILTCFKRYKCFKNVLNNK